jgi:predicted nucleic acid-binding protein
VPIDGVVADANVLLSAVIGKAALRVFTQFEIDVHVTQFNCNEVAEYLPHMAHKYGLSVELVEMQWKLLPRRLHSIAEYRRCLPQAIADIAHRDAEDAHALALARSLGLPIWSNDKDFDNLDVQCFSTARLLRALA